MTEERVAEARRVLALLEEQKQADSDPASRKSIQDDIFDLVEFINGEIACSDE